MFESRHRSTGGSANRWLVVAGAGLVILALVARMLLDIGHTRVSDLAAAIRPDTAPAAAAAPSPPVASADSATSAGATAVPATPPPVLKTDTAPQPAPRPAPPPPVKPATTPASSSVGGAYAVQIGAFGSEANAKKLGDRAAALGYRTEVTPQARGATTLYLVRIPQLASPADARQAADSLQRALAVKAVVLPAGK